MKVPIFFICFISFTIAIQIMMRRNSNSFHDILKKFTNEEERANKTIKHKPDDLPFIDPKKENLPIKEYEDNPKNKKAIKLQKAVLRKAELKMIKLEKTYSNTELKLKYGTNNLDKITFLEEHYNSYIMALYDWAKELVNLENYKDAKIVLNQAISLNTDLSKTYMLLADLYEIDNEGDELKKLLEIAENANMYQKDKVLKHIKNKIDFLEN